MTAIGVVQEVEAFDLTDDEVVALAAQHGRPWPSWLPTVRLDSQQEFDMSVQRGLRSLVARHWIWLTGSDGSVGNLEPRLGAVIVHLLEGRGRFGTLVTLPGTEGSDPQSVATAHYETADGVWTSEVIASSGLHRVGPSERVRCERALVDFLADWLKASLDRAPSSGSFEAYAIGPASDLPKVVAVDGGRLLACSGHGPDADISELQLPDAALSFLSS